MAKLLGLSGRAVLGATGGGSGPLSIDGVVPVPLSGVLVSRACALSDHEVIYQRCDGARCWLEVYDVDTQRVRVVAGEGANFLVAGDGVWAARGLGYFDSFGRRSADRWPLAVDPITGEVYSAQGDSVTRWDASGPTTLLRTPVLSVSAYGGAWVASPAPKSLITSWSGEVSIPATHSPCLGTPHLVVGNGPGGLVLLDFSLRRWALLAAGNAFTPVIGPTTSGYRIASSRTAGEAPTDLQVHDVDFVLTSCNGQSIQWRAFADVPGDYAPVRQITTPLYFGAYTFGRPSKNLPHNVMVQVALGQTRAPVLDTSNREVAYYVAGSPSDGSITDIERAIREERAAGHVRIVAYLPKTLLDANVFSSADVQGIEAYRRKAETEQEFTARLRRALRACRSHGWKAAIIPQAHTSNPGLHPDVRLIPRLVVPLIEEFIDIVTFVFLFSAGDGRAGGWNDNPSYHEDWRHVFAQTPAPVVTPEPKPPTKEPTMRDRLLPNETLETFGKLTSAGDEFQTEVQGDLNLVTINKRTNTLVWASHIAADKLTMQGDGNLVATLNGAWAWHSGTQGNPGAWLFLSGDGRLIVFSASGVPLWYADRDLTAPPVVEPVPVEPTPTPEPGQPITRLAISGRRIDRVLRGVTSFKLLHHFIHDRPAYERAVADVLAHGCNLVRVLTSCRGMFRLDAAEARASLPSFLGDLRSRGLYTSVVALADTASWDWENHADQVARLIEAHPNALYEYANEPWHDTQDEALHDMAFCQREFDRIRPQCIGTVGPGYADEDLQPQGHFVTRHLDRGRDKWNMVRRVRELELLSGETQKPVVNWEPIGFGEHDQSGRRIADRDIALAFGVLSRVFSVPTVFHCESGLSSSPLGTVQSTCARDFIAGTKVWPDDGHLVFKNATWHDSPIRSFNTAGAVRAYSGISGSSGVLCVLGITGDPRLEFQHGWRITDVIHDRTAIKVYRITQ